ncbi:MAG: sigma-70 family RNA polymerase sigma factor [Candidatus Marinimicrobia bacterium]|nr:sigma-70 family RNA polymerase sigma factor [Candidatus Neomarinimicrobiota bacterium]MEA3392987.1 sigma-70 family RNA polymerase sigma factor [Candidatus Neomarinimicrobiota bacterium]
MVKKREFENWVTDYHDRIYATIFHIVGNEDDALDCTQDVFLKAYKKRSSFRGDSSPYTWLRRIATNYALNFVTRNKTSHWNEFHEYEHAGQEDEKEIRKFQSNWLDHLSKMERLVVESRIFEKLSFREVAEKLKTSENSAKVLYHKAIKKLQQVVK